MPDATADSSYVQSLGRSFIAASMDFGSESLRPFAMRSSACWNFMTTSAASTAAST